MRVIHGMSGVPRALSLELGQRCRRKTGRAHPPLGEQARVLFRISAVYDFKSPTSFSAWSSRPEKSFIAS